MRNEFLSSRNGKKLNLGFFRPNLCELGIFHPYFVCKCSFREISRIKMVILDHSKPISLILKIEKSKISNLEIVGFLFIKMEIRQVCNPF